MITDKDKILLEVAYDLISEVFTNICNSAIENKEILTGECFDILRRICLFSNKFDWWQRWGGNDD